MKTIIVFLIGTAVGYALMSVALPPPSSREIMFHVAGYNAGFYDAQHGIYKGEN